MKKTTLRSVICIFICLLCFPACLSYLLALAALPSLLQSYPYILNPKIIFLLIAYSGIIAWLLLIHLSNLWIDDIKLGKTLPYIATSLAITCISFFSQFKLENLLIIIGVCSPGILFACYLVYWHSKPFQIKTDK